MQLSFFAQMLGQNIAHLLGNGDKKVELGARSEVRGLVWPESVWRLRVGRTLHYR